MIATTTPTADPSPADRIHAFFQDHGLAERPDVALGAEAAEHLRVPRRDEADSFVLHAPLELAARMALLPFVRPRDRELARLRLASLLVRFDDAGPPVEVPRADRFDSTGEAAAWLATAVERGELDDVDAAAAWLGRAATASELTNLLAGEVVPRLAAAAHAPIFLYQLPRVASRGELTGELLRGLARELARHPDWRLHWIDDRPAGAAASPSALFDAVATAGRSTPPDLPFIFPLMSLVDSNGVAPDALADVTAGPGIGERGRALLRAAAWSMLLEPGDHAPYGWSHCLTMPQAVLGVASALPDPSRALAVAATYVVGFRSSLAQRPLEPSPPANPGSIELEDALGESPALAAAVVWHLAEPALAEAQIALATNAATSHDAHLVKYTLACLDAAADDPGHRRLFLAAAASLASWWRVNGDADDPLP